MIHPSDQNINLDHSLETVTGTGAADVSAGISGAGVGAFSTNGAESDSTEIPTVDLALSSRVIIVGAGCFGLSTAYHLLMRGYGDVTVLDRSSILPAPDAASNDINRIIRSSYSDKFYTGLAREAIDSWKDTNLWGDTYHESGVVVLGFDSGMEKPSLTPGAQEGEHMTVAPGAPTYADESFANDLAFGCRLVPLPDPASLRSAFPSKVRTGSFEGGSGSQGHTAMGYLNRDGGWADAGQGARIMLFNIMKLGAHVYPGKTVFRINQRDGKATGVLCSDGAVFEADLVIIATGSWTPSAFPDLDLQGSCLATGQCVAMMQLTKEVAERYEDDPVVLDFASGFYVFPPTSKNVIKMAIHGSGFTHKVDGAISIPRTIMSDPDTGLAIPKSALHQLRNSLREIYPELAEIPIVGTRLCWYNDSPDGDWVIGRHPTVRNVVLATAGNGHAYKFLPVIGRLVADLVDGTLDPALVAKFAVDRVHSRFDASRSGTAAELDLSQLCSPTDLDTWSY